jgi:hypothetical protein
MTTAALARAPLAPGRRSHGIGLAVVRRDRGDGGWVTADTADDGPTGSHPERRSDDVTVSTPEDSVGAGAARTGGGRTDNGSGTVSERDSGMEATAAAGVASIEGDQHFEHLTIQ